MTISFSRSELINLAIGIEKKGIVFYDIMARSTESAIAREVFHVLVEMEREHVQIFEEMLDQADRYEISESDGEQQAYLESLMESGVFNEDSVTSETAAQVDSDTGALELGINMEKDSLLFYYELRDRLVPPTQSAVNQIIAEEKRHLSQLSELKKRLSNAGSRDTE